ncbi:MAG: pyridoxal-phosphate dependent enzyme, partial [Nevskiales bacterium]
DDTSPTLGSSSAHEILDVLLQTLKENPERVDLWMMRFQILGALGLKSDFASAMQEASSSQTLRRDIDWAVVARMWRGLAPGEPPPAGVRLRKSDLSAPVAKEPDVPTEKLRRFSDHAEQAARADLDRLAEEYRTVRSKPDFFTGVAREMREVLQRPTPLHHALALERELDSVARIFLKRENLRHTTPDDEIAAAQSYIAVLLGKDIVLTGNDVDKFSVALAQMAPRFGLKATIVVRPADFQQKVAHVAKLRDMGANVEAIRSDIHKSEDPREGALLLWTHMDSNAHLALSLGTGPHPYPRMISDFQMQLGHETELQLRALTDPGRPRTFVAAVHSEADSIGFVLPHLRREGTDIFYAETEQGSRGRWKSSARLRAYNGARREHEWLRATGQITHIPIKDAQARHAQELVKRLEDISIGLEDARALALAMGLAQSDSGDQDIVVLAS